MCVCVSVCVCMCVTWGRLKKEHTSTIATMVHGEAEAILVTAAGAGIDMYI